MSENLIKLLLRNTHVSTGFLRGFDADSVERWQIQNVHWQFLHGVKQSWCNVAALSLSRISCYQHARSVRRRSLPHVAVVKSKFQMSKLRSKQLFLPVGYNADSAFLDTHDQVFCYLMKLR